MCVGMLSRLSLCVRAIWSSTDGGAFVGLRLGRQAFDLFAAVLKQMGLGDRSSWSKLWGYQKVRFSKHAALTALSADLLRSGIIILFPSSVGSFVDK